MDDVTKRTLGFLLGAAIGVFILAMLFFTNVQAGERWVVLGDGTATAIQENAVVPHPDQRWTALVQTRTGHEIINLAGGAEGWAINQVVTITKAATLKALGFDKVILAYGTNDFGTGQNLGVVAAGIGRVVGALKAQGFTVVCLTPIYRTDWQTRRGPNPGQQSARGNPLFTNPANPGVIGYANFMGGYCSFNGAQVIQGQQAPVRFDQLGGWFFRMFLNIDGHDRMATFMTTQMRAKGHWQ